MTFSKAATRSLSLESESRFLQIKSGQKMMMYGIWANIFISWNALHMTWLSFFNPWAMSIIVHISSDIKQWAKMYIEYIILLQITVCTYKVLITLCRTLIFSVRLRVRDWFTCSDLSENKAAKTQCYFEGHNTVAGAAHKAITDQFITALPNWKVLIYHGELKCWCTTGNSGRVWQLTRI